MDSEKIEIFYRKLSSNLNSSILQSKGKKYKLFDDKKYELSYVGFSDSPHAHLQMADRGHSSDLEGRWQMKYHRELKQITLEYEQVHFQY